MFKKFEITKQRLELGLSCLDPELALAITRTRNGYELTPREEAQCDTWLGCMNVQQWRDDKSPYYRIYPGVMEFLLGLDLDELIATELSPLPFGLSTVEIEIPDTFWETLDFRSVIIGDIGNYYALSIQTKDGGYSYNLINKAEIRKDLEGKNQETKDFIKIIYGVLAIGNNPDIVKPVVLRADARKYEETGDEKYVEKAKRRGVFGFNIGEGIPTKAERKALATSKEPGTKAAHIRQKHLHKYHYGPGGQFIKVILLDTMIIHKEKLTEIPQGYYGKK